MILQESALDYRLDPQLQLQCSDEVTLTFWASSSETLPPAVNDCVSVSVCVSDPSALCGGGGGAGTDGSGRGVSKI